MFSFFLSCVVSMPWRRQPFRAAACVLCGWAAWRPAWWSGGAGLLKKGFAATVCYAWL